MDEKECLRVLGLAKGATQDEIGHAYHLLKHIYSDDSANYAAPAMDEFSPQARAQVLKEIETAFAMLCRVQAEAQRLFHPPAQPLDAALPVDGHTLRGVRESLGITLEYLASQTYIRLDHLSALEEERFVDLPTAAVNVRGFLLAYLMEVGLTPDRIVPEYMQRYQQWQVGKAK